MREEGKNSSSLKEKIIILRGLPGTGCINRYESHVGVGPKEGQPQRLGPRIGDDQVKFLEAYEEDKRQGRAPLKLDSTWPNTPRGFQNAFKAKWADYTDVYEIVPSGLYPNEDAIPPDIEIAPALPHEDHSQAALESCFSNMALDS